MFFLIDDDTPAEMIIATPIAVSIILTCIKFTLAPSLSWTLCLFPIWGLILLVGVYSISVLVALVLRAIWQSIF